VGLARRQPRAPAAAVDEERLCRALAPLTRLTRLSLTACGLGAVPAEVGAEHVQGLQDVVNL